MNTNKYYLENPQNLRDLFYNINSDIPTDELIIQGEMNIDLSRNLHDYIVPSVVIDSQY